MLEQMAQQFQGHLKSMIHMPLKPNARYVSLLRRLPFLQRLWRSSQLVSIDLLLIYFKCQNPFADWFNTINHLYFSLQTVVILISLSLIKAISIVVNMSLWPGWSIKCLKSLILVKLVLKMLNSQGLNLCIACTYINWWLSLFFYFYYSFWHQQTNRK